MKKGLMIFVALSIALLMGASVLVAQEKAAVEKEMTCKKEMKVTDEQKTKLEELKTSLRLKMIDLEAEREKFGIMLEKEMMKPEPLMKDVEGIVKKMSAVREQIQLARIEHMLAVRKIVGPEAFKSMHGGMGMGCGMMGKQGMSCGEENDGCMMMREPGRGRGEEGGMPAGRMMRMRTGRSGCAMGTGAGREGRGSEGKKSCGANAMQGGCAMAKGAPGMGCREGAMKARCEMMMKKCEGRSPRTYGNWNHKMFRPFGKKECCPNMSGCRMGKGAAGACCGKGAMKGGCMMGKGAAAGCAKEAAGAEIKCKMEIKEEAQKK